jgi:hypothetical protein
VLSAPTAAKVDSSNGATDVGLAALALLALAIAAGSLLGFAARLQSASRWG